MPDGERADLLARARAVHALKEREAASSLLEWIPFAAPELRRPKALAEVCVVWDDIQQGKQVFACVEAPPRHRKTTTAFHAIARLLRFRPKARVIFGTYNAQFARECSQACRMIALQSGVFVERQQRQRFGPMQSIHYWQTDKLGSAKFVGRGTAAIGSGADLWLIDDPLKNRAEAESTSESDGAWQWIQSDCFTRLEPGGSFVIEHQRWNERDPIGRMRQLVEGGKVPPELAAMKRVPWRFISLPAINADGSPLDPERFDLDALAVLRVVVGEYNWWSQYMQKPRPPGGKMFRGLGRWVTASDAHGNELGIVVLGAWLPVPDLNGATLVLAIDSAGSDESTSDWTSVVLLALRWTKSEAAILESSDPELARQLGVHRGLELEADVICAWRKQLTSPDVVDFVESIMRSLPGVPVVFETQGGDGRAQAQFLTQRNPGAPIHTVTTTTSKPLRATPCANSANRGRLRVPLEYAEWVADFCAEFDRFTGLGSEKNDQVDATAHGWNFGLRAGPPAPALSGGERAAQRGGF